MGKSHGIQHHQMLHGVFLFNYQPSPIHVGDEGINQRSEISWGHGRYTQCSMNIRSWYVLKRLMAPKLPFFIGTMMKIAIEFTDIEEPMSCSHRTILRLITG